jgi:electron transport complex protein RnfG
MSDEIRKEKGAVGPHGEEGADGGGQPREDSRPKDDELYTPQGGGGGTGSGPIREVAAVEGGPRVGPREDLREDVLRPGKVTLPQVADRLAEKRGGADGAEGTGPGGPPGPEEEVSSFRLVLTLALAGAVAGALLVFVFLWSQPQIQAYDAMVLREAVTEVLHGPDHFESVFLHDGALMTADRLPEGVDTLELDRVFLGYDQSGDPVGFALQAEGFGFQDLITLIFGYDPGTREVLGMKVLKHLETPGLGDKIVKDSVFVRGFEGAEAPIQGVKPDRNTGDPHQVDMITGATISSTAVIRIINDRLAEMGDLLAAYQPAGGGEEGDR